MQGIWEGFPGGRPLFIGSLPFRDHDQALNEVLQRTPETPHWVQLPSHAGENFLFQFCQGLPGLRLQPALVVDNRSPEFEEELLAFYEEFLAVSDGRTPVEGSRFSISMEAAPGIYLFRKRVGNRRPRVVKGQISGPLTVLTGIQDADARWAYYDERIRDAAVKLITLKARWQTRFLRECGGQPLVVVDEPAFGHLGSSAFIAVSPQTAVADLAEILGGIRQEGGWPGVHVCANADWGTLLLPDLRVLSFDAFSYFERLALFRSQVREFLRGGGILAWGIVPTSTEALLQADGPGLAKRWISQAAELAQEEFSVEEILEKSFITPSCGLGSLAPEMADRAMDLTAEVSRILRTG